jgi:hypothetical protein
LLNYAKQVSQRAYLLIGQIFADELEITLVEPRRLNAN